MCVETRVTGKVGEGFSFILGMFPTAGSKLEDGMSFPGPGLSQTGLRPDPRHAQTVGVVRGGAHLT